MPWRYILRRLAIAVVQLSVISVAVFFLMRALPSDPVGHLVGFNASPEAIAHVRSPDGGAADAVFTVGFCFGGRNSFNQAARGHDLAGVIGFYGFPKQRGPDDMSAPVVMAKAYRCPVLGLFGGDDRSISRADIDAFRDALDAAGVKNEIVVYDRAPHSFFDRTFDQYRWECDDAWKRMLRFVEDNA